MIELLLTCEQSEELRRHVESVLPREAVGLLGGHSDGRIVRVLPLLNRSTDRFSFFADPYAQYLAERELRSAGLEIIGIYHSHPGGGASLSEADLHFAREWNCVQVVVVLPATGPMEVRGFSVREAEVLEVPIRVEAARLSGRGL